LLPNSDFSPALPPDPQEGGPKSNIPILILLCMLLRSILPPWLASIHRMRSRGDCERLVIFQNTLHAISLFALFECGDIAFAYHDGSLPFGIKCCVFLGRLDSSMASIGMTICFANSRIIFSVAHPKNMSGLPEPPHVRIHII
jgi:hypothetical protein